MNPPVKRGEPPADARRDRWTAHREERRREFVDAALRVLEAQGPELPMDAVAAEAGVTKPVLYRYFSDKAALVQALGERGAAFLNERLLPAISSNGPAHARVSEAVGAYFAVIDEHPNLYWLMARHATGAEAEPEGSGVAEQNREFIATTLTAVIGDYLRFFGVDSGSAEPWAYGITGLVQSTGEWWLQRRSMSRVRVVEYVTQLIWAALSGVLRDAGIHVDPDTPFPSARPKLALRTEDEAPGDRQQA
ncbi:MAG TPA: TetR/AcrR family transcriptional regulator [Streptosporangiaceae bacterium]|jgi:AcrR family transcriptional regulator|nr:TetR/AcrR family transcriptional regulator [Streptosporangiaceae bacterium]